MSTKQGSKNKVCINNLRNLAPPRKMMIGVIVNRKWEYKKYLNEEYKKGNESFFYELLNVYKEASKYGEITLLASNNASWIKEGFREFFVSVLKSLDCVCDKKVDLDAPF